MENCSHANWRYARRLLKDDIYHYCAQCVQCHAIVKLPQHQDKLFINANEIPDGELIHPFIGGNELPRGKHD